MSKFIQTIKKAAPRFGNGSNVPVVDDPKSPQSVRNLSNTISPVMLQRLRQDVRTWRECISEAEQAWYPHRVRMQQLYIDTILNGHVFSLMERRKDLTLLRDFKICNDKGEADETWTAYLKKQKWFSLYLAYVLDAKFFGYSLIALGDMENEAFPNISIVRRWNVSPDRNNVTKLIYSLSGTPFLDEPWADWHIWVTTQSETGATSCGYGLFYKIGLYEIYLRNLLGFNGDFVELFSQPYRVGKTTKTTESERAELEAAVQKMGSAGYAILDQEDEIQFLETKLGGTGFLGYDNLEKRLLAVVSKLILGHENAMSEQPGGLGASNGADNPVHDALMDKQTTDGRDCEHETNTQLFPKMRNLGINIPQELHFEFVNDEEKEAMRSKEDASNLITSQIALTMFQAGLQYDADAFEERTGIPTAAVPKPVAPIAKPAAPLDEKVKNKLHKLYSKK